MTAPIRPVIVDTDTGSDDVWAIIEALRAVDVVRVEAITVVCGNLPLELCSKNAILAAEAAGTYIPPVYRGMARPMMRDQPFYAAHVHGEDGLGGMDLPDPARTAGREHALDAIIRIAREYAGRLEIVTCGPLTNLAMAVLKEPRLAGWVKRAWILGGSALGAGNMTPAAEYNIYTDPEAAAIVLTSGMDTCWVAWDACGADGEITPEETVRLERASVPAARFCARCTRQLRRYYRDAHGRDTYNIVDTAVMTAALYPQVMAEVVRADCAVELAGTETRGYFRVRRSGGTPNCSVCMKLDAAQYKKKLFQLLGAD